MNLDRVKELLALMKANGLTEIEVEEDGVRIRLQKGLAPEVTVQTVDTAITRASDVSSAAAAEEPADGDTITAPMVGTYYSSPSPDAPPYVSVGDKIAAETIVCIIEAMKVMNEVKAGIDGEVLEVMAENGAPVEFGQALFRVEV